VYHMLVMQYSKPPIVEAVIDFRYELSQSTNEKNIASFHEKIKTRYPIKQEQRAFENAVQLGPNPHLKSKDLGVTGYLFKSANEKNILQCKLNGFTFSQLAPYDHWTPFRDAAKELWSLYTHIGIEKVTRVATRYINLIDLPPQIMEVDDYINGLPKLPPDMEVELVNFFNKIQIMEKTTKVSAIVMQGIQPSKKPGQISILLDIDAFITSRYEHPFDDLWADLDRVKKFEDKIFEALSTIKAKELFK